MKGDNHNQTFIAFVPFREFSKVQKREVANDTSKEKRNIHTC